MTKEKRNFDKAAATWDENPGRIKMALSVFGAISRNVELTGDMDVMDFGCGTGLLSLQLLPHVKTVTGADSSPGMLEVLNSKISAQNLSGIRTIHMEENEKLNGTYNVVTCSMTMHHVEHPAQLIREFYSILHDGGHLCITDLDPDKGNFHDSSEGVFHNGFPRGDMKKMFTDAGFRDVNDITAAEVEKPSTNGEKNTFTIFLVTGRK